MYLVRRAVSCVRVVAYHVLNLHSCYRIATSDCLCNCSCLCIAWSCRLIQSIAEPAVEVLILEDALGGGEYARCESTAGLDWAHSRLAVEKLALLHAASVVYFAKV